MRAFRCLVLCLVATAAVPGWSAEEAPRGEVRLVLQITVDGLRGDLLDRYGKHFGEDGFRSLLARGVVYANTHYRHANTETIVGHTTLATGSYPRDHGMVANLWLDRETGEPKYNIEDADHLLLPSRKNAAKGGQVDPTQRAARTNGRSPKGIRGTTFSDELFSHTAGKAKVFAVSGKDRGAVPLAGHSGKAFWFSTDTGDFITSRYYYEKYPDWAAEWNAKRLAAKQAGRSWKLLEDAATYLLADRDDRPYEIDLKGFGRTFPHPFGPLDHPLFNTRVLISPEGDRLTADFAKQILLREKLGKDAVPDYLSVSFSGVDAVNHFFGPSSLENEDQVRQLDRTLADLLGFVDEHVGLDRTLVVLCADHGMAEMPEAMAEMGHAVGRLYSEDIAAVAERALTEHYGVDGLVRLFFRPYLYLDDGNLKGLDRNEVAEVAAAAIAAMEGIAMAVPRAHQQFLRDEGPLGRVQRNYDPQRSGDVYVAQLPYWFLFERGPIAGMHGSPWRYDTFVPLMFAGPGIRARKTHRRVHPSDVAPTLAAVMGVKPPALARGTPLVEVLERDGKK